MVSENSLCFWVDYLRSKSLYCVPFFFFHSWSEKIFGNIFPKLPGQTLHMAHHLSSRASWYVFISFMPYMLKSRWNSPGSERSQNKLLNLKEQWNHVSFGVRVEYAILSMSFGCKIWISTCRMFSKKIVNSSLMKRKYFQKL